MWIITGNTVGQFQNPVFTIPVRQMIQKILHRLINRHMVGIQIADYVPIPHFHPFIHRIHRDTRQHPLVYRTKIEIKTIPFAIFHFRGQRIVSKFITALHKFVHLQAKALLFSQAVAFGHSLTFFVYVSYHLAYQHRIFSFVITHDGSSGYLLFRDAGVVTIFGKWDY